MDLNYLYKRHGIALFMADNAACLSSRRTHLAFAAEYARRIEDARAPAPSLAA